ncbi:hypothetical protein HYALB_00002601 [Hymenoscyphus albidus]|uniref:LysM domain-containing protein n=1 Tax=Hymenoscyphus albidus TaxID=595503 RepID=A0A9N9Q999_9HELO|nr:hypothetical protein HYALB_00002601 [Hymenoscyphus albidus]
MSNYTVQSGDTFASIATKNGTTIDALEKANPGVKPTALAVGQVINLSTNMSSSYTIKAGDTLGAIAASQNIDVSSIERENPGLVPTNLQVGAQIKIPSSCSNQPAFLTKLSAHSHPQPPTHSPPRAAKSHTIQSGDTFTVIATKYGTTTEAIEAANPGTTSTALQVGQVINLPKGPSTLQSSITQLFNLPNTIKNHLSPAPQLFNPNLGAGCETGHGYKPYSGPPCNYPPQHLWAPYPVLWSQNAPLMAHHNTPHQIRIIDRAIHHLAYETGLDPRAILCLIMQESGGNVHVGTTFNGVTNTGLMQAYDGVSFDPRWEEESIFQMIRDGAAGSRNGPGLRQAWEGNGWDYFVAFRVYNSGNANLEDLNDPRGATGSYVVDMGNRLMGHVWGGM